MAAAWRAIVPSIWLQRLHGEGSSVRAPLLQGIYGKPVAIQVPDGRGGTQTTTTIADDRYIHDSIVLPEQEIAAGYQPIMPTFRGRLSEEEIVQLVDYIKSLSTSSSTGTSTSRAVAPAPRASNAAQ
jgi:cytochrome c oxidase subunit 2